jgi:hypothetical protein
MTSYKKLEKIAEAHNVDVQTGSEGGRLVIELWGRKEDLQKMRLRLPRPASLRDSRGE